MGQTLTHGIYLPDEGERNCYNGLASNWNILDGAVGTIAEHTSALSGKAPLVHTHTKSDITDFPAYGTTAGTICEGNDSRLSDARTPVAHTHTKSDVTDLFNSANTWSEQNTFSNHMYIYGQWKGLYFKNPEVTAGVAPSGDKRNYISFVDANGYDLGSIVLNVIGANSTWLQTGISAKDVNDSSQSIYCGTQYRVYGNGEKYFNPSTNGDVHLGTSTLKWATLNGINPGALSLPNHDSTQYDPIDFSQWNVSLGWGNNYVPQSDGWIHVNIKDSIDCSVFAFSYNPLYAVSAYGNGSQGLPGRVALMMPVRAGITYTFMVKASSTSDIYSAIFIPALGNV